MQIFVKSLNWQTGHKTIALEVDPSNPIFYVKYKIEKELRTPAGLRIHALFYRHKFLDENKSLAFYNITRGATLRSTVVAQTQYWFTANQTATSCTVQQMTPASRPIEDVTRTQFAGSAIKQGAGRIEEWDKWKPWDAEYLWLLMGGAMKPPKSVNISIRKSHGSGNFLDGVLLDLRNMQQALKKAKLQMDNTLSDLKMTKKSAENHLKEFFELCTNQGLVPIVYYTGHGETGTGNWCFSDGTINIEEIQGLLPFGCLYPLLISDTCFSGHWANYCFRNPGKMDCLAAVPEFSVALDTADGGGDFTKWMTGGCRPRTEPMWSGGSLADFPITPGYNKLDLVTHIAEMIVVGRKDLECPVCFSTAEGLIYQCTRGHLICQECLPSLKLCPECRTEYPNSPLRHRIAEKKAEEIKMLYSEWNTLDGI